MKSEKVKYYKDKYLEAKDIINYHKQVVLALRKEVDILINHNNELKAEKQEYAKILKQEYAKVFNLYSNLLKQKEHYETALNTIDLTITHCNDSICKGTTTNTTRTS